METDADTLLHQLHIPAKDLPRALVTCWIVWIRLFDFDVKHVPWRLNVGPDGLPRQPGGPREPEPEEEHGLDKTIDASLWGIRVEQELNQKSRERA